VATSSVQYITDGDSAAY